MALTASKVYRSEQMDFSRGIVGGVSDLGLGKIKHVRFADNVLFRPMRSMRVRPGCQDIMNATLTEPPLSLGKFYGSAGNKVFVHTDTGGGVGSLWRITTTGPVKQTTPFALTDERMSFVMVNGILVATQEGGANPPMFFAATNPAETWHSLVLTAPLQATTFGADQAGGSLTVSRDYFYRVRWRDANGSSKTSPVSAARQVVAASGQYTIRVQNLTPTDQGVTARSDYVGWTIERSKAGGTVLGPFYTVNDGTATTYDDGAADADLFDMTSEVIHGIPPHVEGLVAHKSRLFGWNGSSIFVSQVIGDEEATGVANFDPTLEYLFSKDDGENIQRAIIQADRLVVGKRRIIHALEGDDPESFRIRVLYEGAGFAGPRAVAAVGQMIYFDSGDGGFFKMSTDRIEPFGYVEIGHYLDPSENRDLTYSNKALVVNYLGDFVLFWYTARPDTVNADILAFDLRIGCWTHLRGWRAVDALVQKDEIDFSRATLLFADPTPVVPAGAAVLSANPSFMVWRDDRSSTQLFTQSLASTGTPRYAANGLAISNSTGTTQALDSAICSDGATGSIVAFLDNRGGSRLDLYVQKLDLNGAPQWTANGVLLCNAAINSTARKELRIVSDGVGGAIIGWLDTRANSTPKLWLQRVNASGVVQWTVNGIQVCTSPTSADGSATILSDGSGGCFVVWSPGTPVVHIQRFNSAGVAQWTANGIVLLPNDAVSKFPSAALDGAGGFFVLADMPVNQMRCFRITPAGATTWNTIVNPTESATLSGTGALVCSDGLGGAYAVWRTNAAPNGEIRAQHINADGTLTIQASALVWAGTTFSQADLRVVQGGVNSCIMVWRENNDIWAQMIEVNRGLLWNLGVALQVCTATGTQSEAQVATDGAGGVIVTWTDQRSGIDVYAQRVLEDGTLAWTADGVVVCSASGNQTLPRIMFTNAPTGEIPSQGVSGYHVWSGFQGFSDYADMNGQYGQTIPLMFETALIDDGQPDSYKDFSRMEFYIESLAAAMTVTMLFEEEIPSVSLSLVGALTGLARYDDGIAKYDDLIYRYGGSGKIIAGTGIPSGSLARRYALRGSADVTTDFLVYGYCVDAQLLPERRWS